MDEATTRAFARVVEKSLQTPTGDAWLRQSHETLIQQYGQGSFNSERALEIYSIAIERSVLSFVGRSTAGVTLRTLRESGITHKMARELLDQFKEATGAVDQRPARKGILAKIVGR